MTMTMPWSSRRPSKGSNTTHTTRVGAAGEHDPAVPGTSADSSKSSGHTKPILDDKSPGVRRIEIIGEFFDGWHKWVLFFFIFLVSYVYGLDGSVRYTYQTYATSGFGQSAQISTVSVVRAIVAAAAQPAYAKISDYFGRISILLISSVFYVIGTIVMSTSDEISGFAGGAVLYQFGFTGVQLLVVILISDLTSLRNRVFFSYIPAMPSLVNSWVAGELAKSVLANTTWKWGIGMFGIIFPVVAVPLIVTLLAAEVRASRSGALAGIPSPVRSLAKAHLWLDFFWQIDLIGLLIIAAVLAFILVPLTLAGGDGSQWATAGIIVPLVIGVVVCIPAFAVWELKLARHPIMPMKVLRDRQVVAALAVAMLLNTAWYTQGDYLQLTLRVAFDQPVREATWIQNIYSFVSVITGILVGLAARYVRKLKYFAVAGTLLFLLAFGLLYKYRGGTESHILAGLIGAEVVLGIAGGLFPYPTQALIQASVQHERTAIVTALYLASYSVGSALGNTIAGGIWINTLPSHIMRRFEEIGIADARELMLSVYGDPIDFIDNNPRGQIGTPERQALMAAYGEVQRYLTIAGLCLSVLLVIASLCLRNPRLGDQQSFEDAEGSDVKEADREGKGGDQYVLRGDEEHGSGEQVEEEHNKITQRY